jgi:tRNA(fMet)-specific endonuclease VapC
VVSFALDSSTVSHALRNEGGAAARLRELGPHGVVLPTVVVFEVRFGLLRMGRHRLQTAFEAMSGAMGTLDFDRETADHAARIRVELEARGTPIGLADLLIAATARRHGCTLVTHNTREFERVPGLLLEDWY